jgi:hypothetical protein
MKNSGLSLLLIPLATALALYLPLSAGLQSPAASTAASAQSAAPGQNLGPNAQSSGNTPAPEPATQSNAANLICRFFGKPANCRQARAQNLSKNDPESEYELQFLIADLPDPKDTRFNYLFDRNLDAIQRALETAGYVLDRFDLPWLERSAENGENKEAVPTGAASDRAAKTPRYLREPGVVLFRDSDNYKDGSTGEKNKLLILFLVGETPTYGVNQTVLLSALDQIAELSAGQTQIRLLAPLFSGSQDSLEFTLQKWLNKVGPQFRPHLKLISGSATAVDRNKFRHYIGDQGEFHATVLPSDFITDSFIKYLKQLDPKAGKIALLTEGNTAYGSAVRKEKQINVQKGGQVNQPNPADSIDPTHNQKKAEQPSLTLNLPFPLHISQLRNASEKAKSARTNSPLDWHDVRRPSLPLLMEDHGETKDVVPLFSTLETASAELVLANLLNEINRERIRYAGVVASDVKDAIFLIREIRRHCPDTVPFTFHSDLLYLRPEVNADLQGALVATTYPLFVQNQLWSAPFDGTDNRLQFPSHLAQGAYNATLALLDMPEKMREYGKPFDKEPGQRRPGLWISIVGNNNLWPVRWWPPDGDYAYAARSAGLPKGLQTLNINLRGGFDSKTTFSALLFLGFIGTVISLAALTQLINSSLSGEEKPPSSAIAPVARRWERWKSAQLKIVNLIDQSWFGETFGDPVFKRAYKFERRVYLFVCCLSVLAMYLLILWAAFLPSWIAESSGLHWFLARLPGDWTNPQKLPVDWIQSYRWVRVLFIVLPLLAYIPTIWLWGSLCDWLYWKTQAWLKSKWPTSNQNTSEPVQEDKPAEPQDSFYFPHWVGFVFALLTTGLAFYLSFCYLRSHPPQEHLFFFLRASDFSSGVSPLVPLLLVGVAAFLWAFCELRRLMLLERLRDPAQGSLPVLNFDHPETRSFAGIKTLEVQLVDLARRHVLRLPASYFALGGMLIPCLYLWSRTIPSVEGRPFDWIFAVAFLLVSLAQGLTFLRFFYLWIALRRLLRQLSHHPLFTQPLPAEAKERFLSLPKINITTPTPNYGPLAFSVQQAGRLYQTLGDSPQATAMTAPLYAAESSLQCALKARAEGRWRDALKERCQTQAELSEFSRLVAQLLESRWRLLHTPDTSPNTPVVKEPATAPTPALTVKPPDWVRPAESYLASCITGFLHQILAHLQNLALFVTLGMILLLLAITSYPFQPRELFLLFGWLLILTIVVVTLAVFAQMSRDKVLSELSGTAPGQVSWNRDFLFRLVLHGLLPILALLGAQFPDAFRQIVAWLTAFQGGK